MKIKTIISILLFGCQFVTLPVIRAQIPDLNLEIVSAPFPDLSGPNQILQDQFGFMWFGTRTGLKKFDGYQVMAYGHDPADSTSLSDNSITALAADKHHHLWVGTINGLNRLNVATGKFKRYQYDAHNPTGLSHHYITALGFDYAGNLWIGTQQGGLNELLLLNEAEQDHPRFRCYQHDPHDSSSLSDNYVRFILMDTLHDQKVLWIGTANGLNSFDLQTRKLCRYVHQPEHPNSLATNDLYSICQDQSGDLWIGASAGWLSQLSITQDGAFHFKHFKLGMNQKIYNITDDGSENLWLATFHHGLYLFKKRTYRIAHYVKENLGIQDIYPTVSISITFIDRTRTLWISTWPHLYKHDPNRKPFKFIAVDPPPTIWLMAIPALCEVDEGFLWLGTYGKGILKYDLRRGLVSNFAPDSTHQRYLSSRFVQSILEDHNGTV